MKADTTRPNFFETVKRHWFRSKEGEKLIRSRYRKFYGRDLDLSDSRTFSEKLYRRMIQVHKQTPSQMTMLVDKLRVRDFVKAKVGDAALVELLWHGTDPSRIPFDRLPERYILKTNHGSGGNIVVNGPANQQEICAKLSGWLRTNYYWREREAQYYGIRPHVLVEELLDDGHALGPFDYKLWCFNGKPQMVQVDNANHSINPFYDMAWNKLDLSYRSEFADFSMEKPEQLSTMCRMAETLSADFDFVRVDLYNVKGHIYFGEMSFTPLAGRLKLAPEDWDVKLGALWESVSE